MNLSDHLHRDVADVRADSSTLARTARKEGARIGRRRTTLRAGGTLAVAAAVAAIVVAPNLRGSDRPSSSAPVASAPGTSLTSASTPPTPAPTPAPDPVDGRTAVAALIDAVAALDGPLALPITIDNPTIYGSGDDGYAGVEAYGQFEATADGHRVTLGVNVQTWSDLGLPIAPACPASYLECESHTHPNGDVVRSYRLDDGKDVAQRFGELISPSRDLRVVVGTSVPLDAAEPVSAAQLRAIVGWPTWSRQLPEEYATKGQALPAFEAQVVSGTPIS